MAFKLDPSRLIFSATFSINRVDLPMELPAPVCTPHALCRQAAKQIRKHTKVRVDDEKHHMLLHWALHDHGLVVNSRDHLRILIKGAYRPAADKKGAASGEVVRFLTRERSVYIQPIEGMSATSKTGALIDAHNAGDYLAEFASVGAASRPKSHAKSKGSQRGAAADAYPACAEVEAEVEAEAAGALQLASLTLRFELADIVRELTATLHPAGGSEGSGKGRAAPSAAQAAPAAVRPDTVRNLDTGEVYHISEIDERVSLGVQPSSLRSISRGATTAARTAGRTRRDPHGAAGSSGGVTAAARC